MKTRRCSTRIPPASPFGVCRWNSQSVCDPGGQAPFPSTAHKYSCCSEKYSWMWQKREGGSQEVWGGWKGDQGRARNKCSSHTVLACKAYVARWAKCIFSFWSFRPSTGSSIAPHSWFIPPVTVVWISRRGNYCPWKFWAVYPFACHFHDVLSSSFGKRLSWNFP